jgi:hypothetical protein
MGKLMSRFGSAAMLAGASLFVIGGQATVHASNSPAVTPKICQSSDADTSSNNYGSDFTNYYFVVNGTSVHCQMDGNVHPGDTVTVYYTDAPPATPTPGEDTKVSDTSTIQSASLAAYNAPEGNSILTDQTLSDCASTFTTSCTGAKGTSGDYYFLTVVVPSCGFQVDFVFGKVITSAEYLSGESYHGDQTFIDSASEPGNSDCDGTPTPSTSPSSSTSPSGGVQGITSSANPTATPTGSVQGISTPSTGAGAGSSLGVDLAAFALLFLGFVSVGLARRQPVELS